MKADFKARNGLNLTYLPFIMKATVDAIGKWPWVNAEIRDNEAIIKRSVNLGMAVAVDDAKGLLVPVIKNAESLSMVGLARALTDLAERARAKTLTIDEMSGASFTITNPGGYGALIGTPILPVGTTAIIDIEAIMKRPVVITDEQGNDAIGIRSMMYLPMTYDHRLVDGAYAAQFLRDLKRNLETWPIDAYIALTERVPLRRQPGGAYLYDLPGLTPYDDAVALMTELAAARSQGAVPDTVILCEHPAVVTLGASADEGADAVSRETLAAHGIAVAVTDRGGRATYHGPGQLVGYPVLDLTDYGRDLRAYVERLESALIGALAELGVPAEVRPGAEYVGVWTPAGAKIASIGVHVSRWITTHGFALNVVVRPGAVLALQPLRPRGPRRHLGRARDGPRGVARRGAGRRRASSSARRCGLRFEAVPVA